MKKHYLYLQILTAVSMFLAVGCHREEVPDRESSTGRLQFHPALNKTYDTRAAESSNDILKSGSAVGSSSNIVIETYTGTPGSSMEKFFSDKLAYSNQGWDITSGIPRFLPEDGMNLYSYFATGYAGEGDLKNVDYSHPQTPATHPELTFTVSNDPLDQVDLVVAKVEGIKSANISIPFRHILSQINFGVKGVDGHEIVVKNIRINNVLNTGTFNYSTMLWTPTTGSVNYNYYFPNRVKSTVGSGTGENYKTQGLPNDSKNSYIFGDGGKFGPGDGETFLYAQTATATYSTKTNTTTPLCNSLMLLPQNITGNSEAYITIDYEIKLSGNVVRKNENVTIKLKDYYDWKPNFRYVYIFEFGDPSKEVGINVIVEPWQTYNGGDGIVGTDELNGTTLFQKHVRSMKSGDKFSVPIGALSSDFLCDWTLYTMDNSFNQGESFTLSFDGKLDDGNFVTINPPFGFKASTTSLKTKGDVTFTATYSYFTNVAELNTAISGGGGNHVFNVSDAVKLDGGINFVGDTSKENSLTLHYLTPYSGNIPERWNKYQDNLIVYFPYDYTLTNNTVPLAYKIYTVEGLKSVFDWMHNGGANPIGANSALETADRMKTNITLAINARYDLAKVYKSKDNATKQQFMPIGNEANPYSGVFDGKGATIENLYIDASFPVVPQGLFGYINNAVKFVHMKNVYIYNDANYVGGIAGRNNGGGCITGCSVSGTIHGGNAGGIAGGNASFIYTCASTATVTSYSPGFSGGIAGYNWGTIQGCYSTSNSINVLGTNYNNVSGCYYVAPSDVNTVTGSTRVPSIAALNGKIPQFNLHGSTLNTQAHFVSGDLDATPPSIMAGDPAGRGNKGVLQGTFIQNWYALGWDQTRWDMEMAVLATLGMEYLVIDQVVEYSEYDPQNPKYISLYPSTQSVFVNNPEYWVTGGTSLEYCLKACKKHGLKLFIGTFFDKRYWDAGKAVTNQTLWKNCITTANNVMRELTTFYFSGASSSKGNYDDVLAGWYFPYEVDDLFFKTDDAQKMLKEGIKTAMNFRTNLANANKPYLFSPFMNGKYSETTGTMSSDEYAKLWSDIVKECGFTEADILSPQDCIGVGKLTIAEIDEWMSKLKTAAGTSQFWINVEIFGKGGDINFLTGQQIPASRKHATKLISFSYPIHYSPYSKRPYLVGDHKAYKLYYDAQ